MSPVAERVAARIPVVGAARAERRSADPAGPVAPPSPPTRARDRRALVAGASVLVVVASIATFAGLFASAGHRIPVVVVERSLTKGQPITAADLGQADLSVSGDVRYIPVAEASQIRGRRAASDIPVGSLLTAADLATAPTVAPGDAVVGVALKDGQFPAAGLAPGEHVLVVQTGTPGSPLAAAAVSSSTTSGATSSGSALTGTGTGVLVPDATVVSAVAPPSSSGGTYALLVSVEVSSALAPDVATASTAGQVSLVLLPGAGAGA